MTIQTVTFLWSDEHGTCEDCGLPAAYRILTDMAPVDYDLRCSVCAASDAADGNTIVRLFED